jgi:hypothetical protein
MTVTNFDHKVVDRLAHDLAPVLEDRGIVMADVTEVDNVERWRKGARRAGRLLGYPVRTALSTDGATVWAVLERPVYPGEQAEAANKVATMIFGPRPFVRLFKPDQ